MSASTGTVDTPTPVPQWRTILTVVLLLLLPVLAGLVVAKRWDADAGFYSTVSQIIATLYIAIAVEFFTAERLLWEDGPDQVLVLALLGSSSLGLFACVRGFLIGGGGPVMTGLAAAGLMACSMLVGLALLRRIRLSERIPPMQVLAVFVVPPVLLLFF